MKNPCGYVWGEHLEGLPCKQHSNDFDEDDHQMVLDFWDTTTTISPI